MPRERFRADHLERPDRYGLLDEPYTVLELRRLHEAVLGEEFQKKDTLRRSMLARLVPTRWVETSTVGRPARRYRRQNR